MRTNRNNGMTLIELPFVLAFLLVGVLVAFWLAHKIGWPGYPIGFFGGIAASGGAVLGVLKIMLLIWPERPVCRNGKCKARDYELRRVGDDLYWFCRCGDRYYYDRYRAPSKFYSVREDGALVPYMMHQAFRGWIPDTDENAV